MRQKVRYIIERLKEGHIFFFVYLPVAMARYNLNMVIGAQKSYGNIDETILLIRYLLGIAETIAFNAGFVSTILEGKVKQYVSVAFKLFAVIYFIKVMLLLFFGIA